MKRGVIFGPLDSGLGCSFERYVKVERSSYSDYHGVVVLVGIQLRRNCRIKLKAGYNQIMNM